MKLFRILFVFASIIFCSFSGDKYRETKHVGMIIPEFTLRNVDDNFISLSNYPNAKGFIVIFICNHCPFAKLYPERLNALNTKYSKLGIPLLAINSMDTSIYEDESFEKMQKLAKSEKYNFPYLYDASQQVGKSFKADHTPHAFIIWKEKNNWVVKYSGAIDDNGEHPEIAVSFIDPAIQNLLNKEPLNNPETKSFGCRIYYRIP